MAARRRLKRQPKRQGGYFTASRILGYLENDFVRVLRKAKLPTRYEPVAVTWKRDGPDWDYLSNRGATDGPSDEQGDPEILVTDRPDSPEWWATFGLRSIKVCRAALRGGDAEGAAVAMARAVQRASRADFPDPDLIREEAATGRKVKAGSMRGAAAGGRARAEKMARRDSTLVRNALDLKRAKPEKTWTQIAAELGQQLKLSPSRAYRIIIKQVR